MAKKSHAPYGKYHNIWEQGLQGLIWGPSSLPSWVCTTLLGRLTIVYHNFRRSGEPREITNQDSFWLDRSAYQSRQLHRDIGGLIAMYTSNVLQVTHLFRLLEQPEVDDHNTRSYTRCAVLKHFHPISDHSFLGWLIFGTQCVKLNVLTLNVLNMGYQDSWPEGFTT